LDHNKFVVCSADNMTVEVFFKNWNFSNWGLIGFDSPKLRLNDGCYVIGGPYKLNVTFTHMSNRYFNTTSYSRQVWDKIHYEARHYFSVSEHITFNITSRDLLAAEQAEEQLNTLDQYIQENAQVFQSMHAPTHGCKLETLHKIVLYIKYCGNGYLCISSFQLQTHALQNTRHL
jgi:hypothetical protein